MNKKVGRTARNGSKGHRSAVSLTIGNAIHRNASQTCVLCFSLSLSFFLFFVFLIFCILICVQYICGVSYHLFLLLIYVLWWTHIGANVSIDGYIAHQEVVQA